MDSVFAGEFALGFSTLATGFGISLGTTGFTSADVVATTGLAATADLASTTGFFP